MADEIDAGQARGEVAKAVIRNCPKPGQLEWTISASPASAYPQR
jgi:hypothetical protein